MPNRLAQEKSPYLLQHKDNPVDWYPWGEEAFERARKEKKLIFLSIGYSTCYWCHVMEKDSFELPEVAAALNKDFVSIKVDREERPDVDKIYMEAVIAISGQGGWPMSVVLTPDLRPVFGGTFFYRAQFLQILDKLAELWKDSPETLRSNAEKVAEFLHQNSASPPAAELGDQIFDHAFQELQQSFDKRFGGFGRAPKFPPSERIMVLLRYFHKTKNDAALKMAKDTLERMARGGMYDQLGGGFHRYSTDAQWLVPHFEKMLYDNAILAVTYVEGFQVTGDEMFASVARETLDYVLREMTDAKGGFLSAQDAGDVGKEGEFYVWKEDELRSLLSAEELDALKKVYSITPQGNFEHQTNVLSLLDDAPWSARTTPLLRSAQTKLLTARNRRKHPHLDDKVLTSWNGLMIAAFAKGHQVLGDARYLAAAQRAAHFIQETLEKDGKLLHRYRDGNAALRATLDDYAFLIQGLLALYESDFDIGWIRWAEKLQAQVDHGFWDRANGGYFFTDTEEQSLIVRKKDFSDEAIPSGNSIAALNLLKLYHFTFKKPYRDQADALLKAASGSLSSYPSAFASALIALDYRTNRVKEIVIIGPEDAPSAVELRSFVWRAFLPNKIIASGEPAALDDLEAAALFRGKTLMEGKSTFYVCEENTCKLPTTAPSEARKLLEQ